MPDSDMPYVRVDQPFDELGLRGGGLRDLSVFFEEDIAAGLLRKAAGRNQDFIKYV